ncbi:conserved serine-threonine rich protein [Paecilomyces variotii No. 5]|uniref:Conserved serine-threonine rich protein n=1 Tax=Byssochlamys spectabilis (strain No. 5 / NBRC 109023) TaxID=1356009 RepID=V5FYZ8_BYSSN|nr:conserved serine-threonine rich protein [Paecilomyces variotii No. 5]
MGLSTIASSNPRAVTGLRKSSVYRRRTAITNSLLPLAYSYSVSECSAGSTSQSRAFWRSCRSDHGSSVRIMQEMEKQRRNYMSRRARALRRQAFLDEQYRWSNWIQPWWGWGSRGYTSHRRGGDFGEGDGSGKPKNDGSGKRGSQGWWENERERFDREMERIKKEVEDDPFAALFGRKPEPMRHHGNGHHGPWSTFCRTFLRLGDETQKPERTNANATSKVTDRKLNIHDTEMKSNAGVNANVYEAPRDSLEKQKANTPATPQADTAFEFDPISGRMVPVRTTPDLSTQNVEGTDNGSDIPVKTFKSYRALFGHKQQEDGTSAIPDKTITSSSPEKTAESKSEAIDADARRNSENNIFYMTPPDEGQAKLSSDPSPKPQDEAGAQAAYDEPFAGTAKDLQKAGHGNRAAQSGQKSNPEATDVPDNDSTNDLGNMEKSATIDKSHQKEYNVEDVKTDDVDLLRPTDIRAPLYSRKTRYEVDSEKQRNRKALEEDYKSYRDLASDINAQELRKRAQGYEVSSKVPQDTATQPPIPQTDHSSSEQGLPDPAIRDVPVLSREVDSEEQVTREIQHAYEDSYGKITVDHRQPAPTLENQTPGTVAPSSITEDLTRASPRHPDMKIVTVGSSQEEQVAQDSHRSSQLDDLLKDTRRFNESRDALMEQITEALGRIERKTPTEPTVTEPASGLNSSTASNTYRVLAYDPSTQSVSSAETSSSFYSINETLHPAEVLPRLNNPAKFLPHFAAMQTDGYEIVSGGGDVLVFQRVREAKTIATVSDDASVVSGSDETAAELQHIGEDSKSSSASTSSSSPRMVHRQETVFSGGPPNWSPYPPPPPVEPTAEDRRKAKEESFMRKTSRRILLTGTATAAVCYAIGVVGEYFRTGGSDGRGPEGFTEFEAERRRRD